MTDYAGFMKRTLYEELLKRGEIFMFSGPAGAYRRFAKDIIIISTAAYETTHPSHANFMKYYRDPDYVALDINGK